MKIIKIDTKNLTASKTALILQKLMEKERIEIKSGDYGCKLLKVKRYNKHYFYVEYTERTHWKYAYICSLPQAISALMGYYYQGIPTSIYYLDHPESLPKNMPGETFAKLREFITFEIPTRLKEMIFAKCSQIKPKQNKQLALF